MAAPSPEVSLELPVEGAPTARSLVLDLLATLRGGSMPVAALVAAAALFGIPAGSVRVALTRLVASERVVRDRRGHYRLGPATRAVEARIASWRDPESRRIAWDGGFAAVLDGVAAPAAATGAGARRARARALRLLGFRTLRPGLHLRPDNLRGGMSGLRLELSALGLPEGDAVVRLSEIDAHAGARLRELFDVRALAAAETALRQELERSLRRLDRLPPDRARVESFLLGGRAIRTLVLDPLLPEEIAPGDARRALAETLRRYDRAGRAAWRPFLARFGLPGLPTPVDARMEESVGAGSPARSPGGGVR